MAGRDDGARARRLAIDEWLSCGLGPYGIERGVREDEERAVIGTTEDEIDGTFGHIDASDELPVGAVDLHLTGGQIDVAGLVLGDTFPACIGEELHIGNGA